jgi:hypothetical protein
VDRLRSELHALRSENGGLRTETQQLFAHNKLLTMELSDTKLVLNSKKKRGGRLPRFTDASITSEEGQAQLQVIKTTRAKAEQDKVVKASKRDATKTQRDAQRATLDDVERMKASTIFSCAGSETDYIHALGCTLLHRSR